MEKNWKYIAGLVFVIVWVVAIIIGYNKGKQKAAMDYVTMEDILPEEKPKDRSLEKVLLSPKPLLSGLSEEALEPKLYSLKINSIKEDISVINEKGDELSPSSSDRLSMDLFAFNIFDNDLKNEDELKSEIKFDLETSDKTKEERYQGLEEKGRNIVPTNSVHGKTRTGMRESGSLMFTNLE